MIPEGWKKKSLEDVAEIRTGLAKGKKTDEAVVHRPYLRVANVQDGYLDLRLMKDIEVREKDIGRYSLQVGDVVLTEGGDFDKLGRGAVWRGQVAGCLHQNHVFAVRTVRSKLLPDFFAAQSASYYGKSYYLSCAKRSTNLASINSTQLKQFPVLVAPLQEQKKITETLATWDRAIETVEALIANARAQKQALMQQLLPQGTTPPKKRLPGFSGEWRETTIEGAASVLVSSVDKKSVKDERPVRLCNYMDVYRSDQIVADMDFMAATATEVQIRKFGLKVSDVIITKDSETPDDIAIPTIIQTTAPDLVCGYHLAILRPKDGTDGQFLKFFFEHPRTRHFFASRANGATRFGLTVGAIETAPISLPSHTEQRAIGNVILTTETEIHRLNPILTALRQEKAALMQQLLTGKRRVKLPESENA